MHLDKKGREDRPVQKVSKEREELTGYPEREETWASPDNEVKREHREK